MTVERLREQVAYIQELRKKNKGFHIFTGIEVDILRDGSLDFPDQVLEELDIVIASIHSGFKQSKEELTGRILAAMENPHVHIIGHPTSRLINKRDPYEIDIERILDRAVETETALEINSSPDRLDLKDEHVRQALSRERGWPSTPIHMGLTIWMIWYTGSSPPAGVWPAKIIFSIHTTRSH